ncbi:MAG: tetratricopeptide repeat protein [Hyphomicrobium sp.]
MPMTSLRSSRLVRLSVLAVLLLVTTPFAIHALAVLIGRAGQHRAAISVYDLAIRISPARAVAYRNRGQAKGALGDAAGGNDDLERALALDPDDRLTRWLRAEALLRLERFDEAAAAARATIDLDPSHAPSHAQLGFALLRMKRFEDALGPLQRAAHLAPTRADVIAYRADAHVQLGNLAQAEIDSREATRLSPVSEYAHRIRGLVGLKSRKWQEAADALTVAISLAPDAWSLAMRAEANLWLKQYRKALDDARRAIALDADHAEAHHHAANAANSLGTYDEALLHARRAASLAPGNGWVMSQVAHALNGLDKFSEAATAAEKALALEPQNAHALRQAGLAKIRTDQPQDAIGYLDRAVVVDANYSLGFSLRAQAKAALNDGRGALGDALVALSLDRKSAWAHFAHARALQVLGDRRGALAAIELAHSLYPSNALIASVRKDVEAMTTGSRI